MFLRAVCASLNALSCVVEKCCHLTLNALCPLPLSFSRPALSVAAPVYHYIPPLPRLSTTTSRHCRHTTLSTTNLHDNQTPPPPPYPIMNLYDCHTLRHTLTPHPTLHPYATPHPPPDPHATPHPHHHSWTWWGRRTTRRVSRTTTLRRAQERTTTLCRPKR